MDPKTLNYIQASTLFISSITLWITWKLNRTLDGTRNWAIGGGVMAFSFLLLTIYTTVFKSTLLAVIATSIGWIGYYFYYRGLCEFLSMKVIRLKISIFIYIFLTILMLYGNYFGDNPKLWRVVVGSLGIAIISFISFYVLIKKPNELNLIRNFMAFTFSLMGVMWTIRIIWSVIDPPLTIDSFRFVDSLTFFMQILFTFCLTIGMIIMTTEKLQQQLREQATTDSLTGLLNRRAFYLASDSIIKKAIREKLSVSIAMIDLDYFKNVNDTYGHAVGDRILTIFALVAKRVLRDHDLIARFGGEEFILLLTGLTREQTMLVLNRLQNAFNNELIEVNGNKINTTLSIGVSNWQMSHFDIEKTIQDADKALYNAKKNGRNRIEFYN